MCPNPQSLVDLVTFTEVILNGKLHFFVQCIFEIVNHETMLIVFVLFRVKKLAIIKKVCTFWLVFRYIVFISLLSL